MQECPCCKEYGDVWEVEFEEFDFEKGKMCFECDSVWELDNQEENIITDFESIASERGVVADWSKVRKVHRVGPS